MSINLLPRHNRTTAPPVAASATATRAQNGTPRSRLNRTSAPMSNGLAILLATVVLCLGWHATTAFAFPPTVQSTPTKIRDYAMRLQASPGVITLSFARHATGSTQTHILSTYKVTYKAKSDLSSATLNGDFNRYGRISMKFRATGPKRKALPPGCDGSAPMSRAGVLTGTFAIKLDSNYFQTVTRRTLDAVLATSTAKYTCIHQATPFPTNSILALTALQPTDPLYTLGVGKDADGRVTQSATLSSVDNTTGIILNRSIFASAKSGILTAAPDVTSAQAQGIAPFFGGTLGFSGDNHGTNDSASGKFSGSFVAKFDSGGPQSFPVGTAVLLKK